jgi:hypothetical protein
MSELIDEKSTVEMGQHKMRRLSFRVSATSTGGAFVYLPVLPKAVVGSPRTASNLQIVPTKWVLLIF